jgi:hypothetical protein
MVAFVQGRAVTTREPTVVVDPGLPVGAHRFQLVAVDTAGLRSRPDVAVVRIAAGTPGPLGGPPRPTGRFRPTKRSHR